MSKKLSLAAVLFSICIILFSATGVKAVAAPAYEVSQRIKLTMVAGETKPIPGLNLRCSAFSEDETIIELDENRDMLAKRVGTGKVTVYEDGKYTEYIITVTGTVDIVVAMGQSNMCGAGGNVYASPEPREGALQYDKGKVKRMEKQETLLPAFANAYNKGTGVPVVIVHYSVGGSSCEGWLKHGYANTAAKMLRKCKNHFKKYNVKVRHIYMLWYQGETDAEKNTSEDAYMDSMRKIYKKMHASGVEKCLMIRIAEYRDRNYGIGNVVSAQYRLCKEKRDKKKFAMVSKKAAAISENRSLYVDAVHLGQTALNMIGKNAGKNAAKLANKKK